MIPAIVILLWTLIPLSSEFFTLSVRQGLFLFWLSPFLWLPKIPSRLCYAALLTSCVGNLLSLPFLQWCALPLSLLSFTSIPLSALPWAFSTLLWTPKIFWSFSILTPFSPAFSFILISLSFLGCRTKKTSTAYQASFGFFFLILVTLVWEQIPLKQAPLHYHDGVEVPLTAYEKKIFKQIALKKRKIEHAGNTYLVTILDGTNNRSAIHDPLTCMWGMGWQPIEQKRIPTPKGTLAWAKLGSENRTKEMIFWYTDTDSHFHSRWQYLFKTSLRRLTRGYSGTEPLLITIQPISCSTCPPELWQHHPLLLL
ncbi:MAG: hypothetical protein KDK65_05485 [Chlamydiia bacterium]|nr:hypothetical protein [Chlamydiia bacterium]